MQLGEVEHNKTLYEMSLFINDQESKDKNNCFRLLSVMGHYITHFIIEQLLRFAR